MSDVRVEIGFTGGGSATSTLAAAEWEQLQAAIMGVNSGWVSVPALDDERLVVNTSQVVFVRVNEVLRNIGFAGAT